MVMAAPPSPSTNNWTSGNPGDGSTPSSLPPSLLFKTNSLRKRYSDELPSPEFVDIFSSWAVQEVVTPSCFGRKIHPRPCFCVLDQSMFSFYTGTNLREKLGSILLTGECAFKLEGKTFSQLVILTPEGTLRFNCANPKLADTWLALMRVARLGAKHNKGRRYIEVYLQKDSNNSLGLSIAGGSESTNPNHTQLYITNLHPNGPAHIQGLLEKGDVITHVNESTLEVSSHTDAIQLIQQAKGEVRLRIMRRPKLKKKPSVTSIPEIHEGSMRKSLPVPTETSSDLTPEHTPKNTVKADPSSSPQRISVSPSVTAPSSPSTPLSLPTIHLEVSPAPTSPPVNPPKLSSDTDIVPRSPTQDSSQPVSSDQTNNDSGIDQVKTPVFSRNDSSVSLDSVTSTTSDDSSDPSKLEERRKKLQGLRSSRKVGADKRETEQMEALKALALIDELEE